VCRAIVALGQSLGVQVLAEGVETAEQAGALLALGCRAMQGFLFSRPVPAEHVRASIAAAQSVARRITGVSARAERLASPAPGETAVEALSFAGEVPR
jgi:predicted signal transduction protein with EAL and GGDEF domain